VPGHKEDDFTATPTSSGCLGRGHCTCSLMQPSCEMQASAAGSRWEDAEKRHQRHVIAENQPRTSDRGHICETRLPVTQRTTGVSKKRLVTGVLREQQAYIDDGYMVRPACNAGRSTSMSDKNEWRCRRRALRRSQNERATSQIKRIAYITPRR
jgi:hypothetical protein